MASLPRWLAERRAACEAAGWRAQEAHGGGRAPHAALLARAPPPQPRTRRPSASPRPTPRRRRHGPRQPPSPPRPFEALRRAPRPPRPPHLDRHRRRRRHCLHRRRHNGPPPPQQPLLRRQVRSHRASCALAAPLSGAAAGTATAMLEVLRVARRGDWALRWFALGVSGYVGTVPSSLCSASATRR